MNEIHATLNTAADATSVSSRNHPAGLSLPSLRRLLVEERDRLRALQDHVRAARARAEQDYIDQRGGDHKSLGSTQQDRERALLLHLDADPSYQRLCLRLAGQERTVETVQAEIEAARDVRREAEGERLDRYIQALVELASSPIVGAAVLPGAPTAHP